MKKLTKETLIEALENIGFKIEGHTGFSLILTPKGKPTGYRVGRKGLWCDLQNNHGGVVFSFDHCWLDDDTRGLVKIEVKGVPSVFCDLYGFNNKEIK